MKRKTNFPAIVLALLTAAGMAACGNKSAEDSVKKAAEVTTAATEAQTEAAAASEEAEETEAAEETAETLAEAASEAEAEEGEEFSPESADYDDILRHCTEILTSEDPWELEMEEDDPFTALFEVSSGSNAGEALRQVGYAFRDLNGDGTDELIIGAVNDDDFGGECSANQIYDIFTEDGDSTRLIFKGWSRNRYYALQSGSYLNEGSGGASSSFFGEFHFGDSSEPLQMHWDACCFTEADADGKLHIYQNNEGSWDKERSEELDMTEEEFWDRQSTCESGTIHTELETMESYNCPVSVCFLEDYGKGADSCSWVTLDDSGHQSHLVLQAKEELTDVKVYKLTVVDVDEDGAVKFDSELLYEQESLPVSLPLGLDLTIEGDLPAYGIAFADADGKQRQYVIQESGMDGSVYLTEQAF